jgi:transposase InsO family protein
MSASMMPHGSRSCRSWPISARRVAKLGVRIECVMTDNGSCYQSKSFRAACKRFGLRQIFTKPYTPKTNGKAERFIQKALRAWAYVRAYHNSDQRSVELLHWPHRYNWHRPDGSLNNTSLSRLHLFEDNLHR